MEFKSYKNQVMAVMKLCKKEFCQGVGTLVVAEAQSLTPVLSGNLRRSETFDVMQNNEGINVGVTKDAPYGLTIEKGLSGHRAQPFLEPGAMNAIPKITEIAKDVYKSKIGGDK